MTNEELNVISYVNEKFKYFSTKEIVLYMHEEKAYIDNKQNDLLSFDYVKYVNLGK